MEQLVQKLTIAIATDDGNNFMDRHFGDAQYYDIYRLDSEEAVLTHRLNNTTDEESDLHADPKKAGSISSLLLQEGVQVVEAKVFGPNIKRIKKKFVCVVIRNMTVSQSLEQLRQHYQELLAAWEDGEERRILTYTG